MSSHIVLTSLSTYVLIYLHSYLMADSYFLTNKPIPFLSRATFSLLADSYWDSLEIWALRELVLSSCALLVRWPSLASEFVRSISSFTFVSSSLLLSKSTRCFSFYFSTYSTPFLTFSICYLKPLIYSFKETIFYLSIFSIWTLRATYSYSFAIFCFSWSLAVWAVCLSNAICSFIFSIYWRSWPV